MNFCSNKYLSMTTFAKLIGDLTGPKVFPSTSPQYKEIRVGRTGLGTEAIGHDGSVISILGQYLPISRNHQRDVVKWKSNAWYASQCSISEPIQHWIATHCGHYYLAEQSVVAPEIIRVYKISTGGTYRGCHQFDIREVYPVSTINWNPYIPSSIIEGIIRAIALTTKIYLNSKDGRDYHKFYDIHGVSADETTFLQFIDTEFGMRTDMRNFIADWLNGAMAGFIVLKPICNLDPGSIVVEQMPRSGNLVAPWHKTLWRSMAASHRARAAAYRQEMMKPMREAAKPILRELLEKKLAGSVLLPEILKSANGIINAVDTDVAAATAELAEFNSREDVATIKALERKNFQLNEDLSSAELALKDANTKIALMSDASVEINRNLQELRHVFTKMDKILHEKADAICARVDDMRNLNVHGLLSHGDINFALGNIQAVANSIKCLSNEKFNIV